MNGCGDAGCVSNGSIRDARTTRWRRRAGRGSITDSVRLARRPSRSAISGESRDAEVAARFRSGIHACPTCRLSSPSLSAWSGRRSIAEEMSIQSVHCRITVMHGQGRQLSSIGAGCGSGRRLPLWVRQIDALPSRSGARARGRSTIRPARRAAGERSAETGRETSLRKRGERRRPRADMQRPVDDLGDAMLGGVEHVLVGGPECAGRIVLVLGGVGHRAPPPIRVGRRWRRKIRESTFLQASAQVRAPARRWVMSVWHTTHCRNSAGAISSWWVSSSMAWAQAVQTDQAWPRFRAFSAMTRRQRRHRRRRPAVRSSNSSASRTVRGSAAALADGCGPDMAVNSITTR